MQAHDIPFTKLINVDQGTREHFHVPKYQREYTWKKWQWVVFIRAGGQVFVLDSASYLPSNVRTDFNEMQPKWFIEVKSA